MVFLETTLGIKVRYPAGTISGLPYYLLDRYQIQPVELDSVNAAFVMPIPPMEPVSTLETHVSQIEKHLGVPGVLVLPSLTSYQKESLIRKRIPFIVENRQIYLPFLGVYLRSRCDGDTPNLDAILPSSQLLLLHFIYGRCRDLLTSEAALALQLTPTSLSRASRQLEQMKLIRTERRGVQKVIRSDKSPRDLFGQAEPFLRNPVKRKVYVPKDLVGNDLLLSGYSALSRYSMLAPQKLECRAVNHLSTWNHVLSRHLEDPANQCQIELWMYDPRLLTCNGCVDRLSLALALRADGDERVETALEEILETIW